MRRYIEENPTHNITNTTVFPPALTSIHGPLNVFIQYIEQQKKRFSCDNCICAEKNYQQNFLFFTKIISIIITLWHS